MQLVCAARLCAFVRVCVCVFCISFCCVSERGGARQERGGTRQERGGTRQDTTEPRQYFASPCANIHMRYK